ncbi:MAG: hypothetical protein O7A07_02475 [Acidobacteria bacterium]|nr:hypothetical protein [Acidobacteriota bacterium]
MKGGGEAGAALADALVSLALTVTVLAAVLPAVLGADRIAGAASRRAVLADGGRLVGRRLTDDLRRAGFGLAGRLPGVVVEEGGGAVDIQYLAGGFQGGTPLTSTAPAGGTRVGVKAVGGFGVGDPVVLVDRQGGFATASVVAWDVSAGWLELSPALARAFGPGEGGRVYRLVRRRWWLDGRLLRRDGQPAMDGVAFLGLATWSTGEAAEALAWVLDAAGEPGTSAPEVVAIRMSVAAESSGVGPKVAVPDLHLGLLLRAANAAPSMAAGSALP